MYDMFLLQMSGAFDAARAGRCSGARCDRRRYRSQLANTQMVGHARNFASDARSGHAAGSLHRDALEVISLLRTPSMRVDCPPSEDRHPYTAQLKSRSARLEERTQLRHSATQSTDSEDRSSGESRQSHRERRRSILLSSSIMRLWRA